MANDLGWLGALGALIAAEDPSGQTGDSFAKGFAQGKKKATPDPATPPVQAQAATPATDLTDTSAPIGPLTPAAPLLDPSLSSAIQSNPEGLSQVANDSSVWGDKPELTLAALADAVQNAKTPNDPAVATAAPAAMGALRTYAAHPEADPTLAMSAVAPVLNAYTHSLVKKKISDGPLLGSGWHKWQAWKQGDDVRGSGTGTVFGGGNDSGDNSVGVFGNTIGPTTQGVSLPTGRVTATKGSPFPQVPAGTLVKVYNRRTGKSAVVPVIDEGPTVNDKDDSGQNGTAMVDIASATAKSLGMDPVNGSDPVDISILGGAKYLQPENVKETVDPNQVDPNDAASLAKIGTLLPKVGAKGPPYDVEPIRDAISSLNSGALRDLAVRMDAHLDLAENTEKSNPALSRQEYKNAMILYGQAMQKFRALQGTK